MNTPPVPPPVRTRPRRRAPTRRKPSLSKKPVRHELSAGGVVARREGQGWLVALLKTEHRKGKVWVLPKGHVELASGERIAEAAKREVQEEAGIKDVSVRNQLGVTHYSFQAEGVLVKKTVHYFLMTTGQKKLVPQEDEGLIEAAWFSIEEAVKQLAYDTDQDIVCRASRQLEQH